MSKHDFLKKELEKKAREQYSKFLEELSIFLSKNKYPALVVYDCNMEKFCFNYKFLNELPYLEEYFIEDYSKKIIEKIEQNIGIANKKP